MNGIPASKTLKLIIENSILKQKLLQIQASELQFSTRQAIEDESKTLGMPIASFNMDAMEFIVQEEIPKE